MRSKKGFEEYSFVEKSIMIRAYVIGYLFGLVTGVGVVLLFVYVF
jgi:hypothetical protein